MKWEMVIGLETHIELATKSKLFCSCSTQFGANPNTHCCPVCTGQPGALPFLNRRAVEYTVLAGLALNCKINGLSKMDRKHYFYPDLPRAFQITQFDLPLCSNGNIELSGGKKIRIARVHLEEDSGKLVHENGKVLVDFNRAGVPLIEIVTKPDFRSASEAVEYLEKLQGILRTIGVSDCRMQEGSMRCDVNISVRMEGSPHFGTRTEIKNLNSFSSVHAAIEYEFDRQRELLKSGRPVLQETLAFNAVTGKTSNMRDKENIDDYRYFREPDIPLIYISEDDIERLRKSIPELPEARIKRYVSEYKLAKADAALLCKYKKVADFFDAAAEGLKNPAVVASFILTQMFGKISTETAREQWDSPIPPEFLRSLVLLLEEKKINHNLAKIILSKMLEEGNDPKSILESEGISTEESISLDELCKIAIAENPAAVQDYLKGKEKALKALIGSVMRMSRGRADANEARNKLLEVLNCKK